MQLQIATPIDEIMIINTVQLKRNQKEDASGNVNMPVVCLSILNI